jgi:hypothetical protein
MTVLFFAGVLLYYECTCTKKVPNRAVAAIDTPAASNEEERRPLKMGGDDEPLSDDGGWVVDFNDGRKKAVVFKV